MSGAFAAPPHLPLRIGLECWHWALHPELPPPQTCNSLGKRVLGVCCGLQRLPRMSTAHTRAPGGERGCWRAGASGHNTSSLASWKMSSLWGTLPQPVLSSLVPRSVIPANYSIFPRVGKAWHFPIENSQLSPCVEGSCQLAAFLY